jgi:hypothetical protein
LEKLFLANNRIEIKQFDQCELAKMQLLKELSIENNPCSQAIAHFVKSIMKFLPGLKLLDGKAVTLMPESQLES